MRLLLKHKPSAGILALILAFPAAAQSGFDNPDPIRASRATLGAGGFPCGDVLSAVRRKDGNLIADCSNGRRYGMVSLGGGRISVVRYNPGNGEWVKP